MYYRIVEYDSGPTGMPGKALINEWAPKGIRSFQACRRNQIIPSPSVAVFSFPGARQ